jgi:hypothetical protein
MTLKQRKKKIKKDRVWNHFLFWCNFKENPAFINMQEVKDYDPERWRTAFEHFQEKGSRGLSSEELTYIKPIVDGQRIKEITLNGLVTESMEFWANGWGWINPFIATLTMHPKVDRLTKVAILRMIRNMQGGKGKYNPNSVVDFFMRHPGISDKTKNHYFNIKANN